MPFIFESPPYSYHRVATRGRYHGVEGHVLFCDGNSFVVIQELGRQPNPYQSWWGSAVLLQVSDASVVVGGVGERESRRGRGGLGQQHGRWVHGGINETATGKQHCKFSPVIISLPLAQPVPQPVEGNPRHNQEVDGGCGPVGVSQLFLPFQHWWLWDLPLIPGPHCLNLVSRRQEVVDTQHLHVEFLKIEADARNVNCVRVKYVLEGKIFKHCSLFPVVAPHLSFDLPGPDV